MQKITHVYYRNFINTFPLSWMVQAEEVKKTRERESVAFKEDARIIKQKKGGVCSIIVHIDDGGMTTIEKQK